MPIIDLIVRCDATQWGEVVAVLGSFNEWNKRDLRFLTTSPQTFPVWNGSVQLDQHLINSDVEYKYVIAKDGHIFRWETNTKQNRSLRILDGTVKSSDLFGKIPISSAFHSAPVSKMASHSNKRHWQPANVSASSLPSYDAASLDALESAIVCFTHENLSWRQRLSFVRSLFTEPSVAENAKFDPMSIDSLATVAIYLSFLSSGQVRCDEDGGHFRPNHHAQEARQIEAALAKVINLTNRLPSSPLQSNQHSNDLWRRAYIPFVARKIFPQLPSYSSQFTVNVPLTRIRDIAHRSDIHHDLKQEIKHTLQNKLHRCAGPEDLHTSANILERISHGGYSEPFVEQFHIFHAELLEFFNATSLDNRLCYLRDCEYTHNLADLASTLLELKTSHGDSVVQLQTLTNLRDGIAKLTLMDSLPGEHTQKTRLSDIDLEAYAFVQMAAVAKDVEMTGLDLSSFHWWKGTTTLALAMQNVKLSSVRPAECAAIAAELNALRVIVETKGTKVRSTTLRLKASVERVLRFSHDFSKAITSVYGQRVTSLGKALSVDKHAISVFTEAEIRSNIMFQASRIATAVISFCRRALSFPPWDVLYAGKVCGRIIYLNTLAETDSVVTLDNDNKVSANESLIVVCNVANGNEDIPACVKGIVTGRTLPHLSHLGVRARQANVVFVCAEERSVFVDLWERGLNGIVELQVTVQDGLERLETVQGDRKGEADSRKSDPSKPQRDVDDTEVRTKSSGSLPLDANSEQVLPIEETSFAQVSAKAALAGQLVRVGEESNGLFEAPSGVALPHGVFQHERRRHSNSYDAVVREYNVIVGSGKNGDEAAAKVSAFIRNNFSVSATAIAAIKNEFNRKERIMVRSSANVEDLADLSGAGLYDSVANVPVADATSLEHAIKSVWASLWTKRAASNRSAYGVPHSAVSMAVLVQRMVRSQISFIAFSHEPVGQGHDIYIEMAIGMGEILASATVDGSPYRFRVEREFYDVEEISFASYSYSLVPANSEDAQSEGNNHGFKSAVVDYSCQRLTSDEKWRHSVVRRIAKIVMLLEDALDGPQDVEGGLIMAGDEVKVYIVQARPQLLT